MDTTSSPPPPQQQQQPYQERPVDQQRQQQPISQYQPYQQQQQQPFQPQGQVMRAVFVSPRGMWTSKLTLRIFSLIFSLVIIGVAAGVTIYDLVTIVEFAPPAGLAFIWNFAESICLCVRRGHRGIAPGAVVALDLLIWIGYLVSVVFLGLFGINDYYYDYYGEYTYGRTSAFARALFAFGILEILLHMALFIIACYETNLRNKNTQVIYIQPGTNVAAMYPAPNYPMAQTYQQPMYPQPVLQQQQQQQHLSGYYAPPPQGQYKSELQLQPAVAPVAPVHHQPSTQHQ